MADESLLDSAAGSSLCSGPRPSETRPDEDALRVGWSNGFVDDAGGRRFVCVVLEQEDHVGFGEISWVLERFEYCCTWQKVSRNSEDYSM